MQNVCKKIKEKTVSQKKKKHDKNYVTVNLFSLQMICVNAVFMLSHRS